ncbi:hypothetical protein LR48_Vigan05g055200 [Vigna angularis]|uniref:Uncharacterized protein n=1 Tax=Phaseolus angularis TaxID=3914 RepID=A0A0L9UJN1_PHAAN|nr:hypothetical protein LR48_Vigan05g055200 [Vigna angularis]
MVVEEDELMHDEGFWTSIWLRDGGLGLQVCFAMTVQRSYGGEDENDDGGRWWLNEVMVVVVVKRIIVFKFTTLISNVAQTWHIVGKAYVGHWPQLSFKHIYGQRAQVPGSIIIDGGSGYCKFGWSKYECPSGRSATFLVLILILN